jgi:hypothetical protein
LPKDADGEDCEDWRCVKDYVEENVDDLPCTTDDEECWKEKL